MGRRKDRYHQRGGGGCLLFLAVREKKGMNGMQVVINRGLYHSFCVIDQEWPEEEFVN